jgi:hypothetical protein
MYFRWEGRRRETLIGFLDAPAGIRIREEARSASGNIAPVILLDCLERFAKELALNSTPGEEFARRNASPVSD